MEITEGIPWRATSLLQNQRAPPNDDSSSGKLMEGILSSFAEFDNAVKS